MTIKRKAVANGSAVDYQKMYEQMKADARAPIEAEAKEFCSSLGLETPEQMRKWCIEKMKESKLMNKLKL
jgi:hypothetical protein